ncbi:MAG: tetratricopeptide repeat protein [Candidatus Sulfotelmatobacter sp.]
MKTLFPLAVSFCSILVLVGFEVQQAGAQGRIPPVTAAPPNTVTRPDSIQDSGFYGYWANMSAQGRAGGVLLGKLALEGEPLPWQPMLVSVDCKGTVVNMTQADLRGQFVIRFVDTHGVERIPADDQRQMETKYEGCQVHASLAGFRSSAVTITVRNLRDEPDLGTITLFPEARSSGTELSSTTKTAPANAMKAFEKARAEWLDQDAGSALGSLKKAVAIYPEFAEAWFQLGKLQEASDPQGARDSFSKALAADPKFVLPYEQLASMAAQQENWREAENNTNQALQLDPAGTPQLWYDDAWAKFQLGKINEASVSAEKSLAIDPRHTVLGTEQLLAVILARKADYAGAIQHLRNCLTYFPAGRDADLVKQQIAQLQRKTKASK